MAMAQMREAPRLGAAIEARLTRGVGTYVATLEEQVMARRLALRDVLARAVSATAASGAPGGGSSSGAAPLPPSEAAALARAVSTGSGSAAEGGVWSWAAFGGAPGAASDASTAAAKAAFVAMTAALAEWCEGATAAAGDDAGGGLRQVALAAYHAVVAIVRGSPPPGCEAGGDACSVAAAVVTAAGLHLAPAQAATLATWVRVLAAWREAQGAGVPPLAHPGSVISRAAVAPPSGRGFVPLAPRWRSGGGASGAPTTADMVATLFPSAPAPTAAAMGGAGRVGAWSVPVRSASAAPLYTPLEVVARATTAPAAAAARGTASSTSGSSKASSAAALAPAARAAPPPATVVVGTAGAAPVVDAVWLFAQAARAAAGSSGALSAEHLAVAVLTAFQAHGSGKAEDETRLQTALFELLGEAHFDFLTLLMEHRRAVTAIPMPDLRRVAGALMSQASAASGAAAAAAVGAPPAGPRTMAPSVVVTTAAGIRAEKERRRTERRAGRARATLAGIQERLAEEAEAGVGAGGGGAAAGGAGGTARDALAAAGFDASYLATERTLGLPPARSGGARRGFLSVEDAIAAVGAGFGADPRRMLPEGTVETSHEGYKQVAVPPAKAAGAGGGGGAAAAARLVAVADLHPVAQAAFRGVTRLNRLQSELFEAAYSSAENLLVCAPTGAGKTNVAMLTVCQQLLACLTPDGRVRREDVKIIYVAPMKALAQEVVAKFSERLGSLGVRVRELTGDIQLTKREIAETQLIVTTPEKWDVITRKAGDGSLVSQVRLLIIDEVHLLADGRGAVIESIVARTLRLVESSQCAVRIVGLSATLPNYQDVALFLRVNPATGLFYFNDAYRPVPLAQTFIGVTEVNPARRTNMFNKIAYDKAMAAIRRGKQVMIFVHSRKDTAKTAAALLELARAEGATALLSPFSGEEAEDPDAAAGGGRLGASVPPPPPPGGGSSAAATVRGEGRVSLNQHEWLALQRDVERSRNRELRELFRDGFGIHHAGMLRADRGIAERSFAAGVTKILVCTATLAWGVNLPAHTVIIKGTQIYNAEVGGFTDVGMLDVMQIFGRAGRPQFDTSGEGIIITAHDKLQFYLQMLTHTVPIESSFIKALPDHLNAEVVSGTVTNLREAVSWLSYTYLFIRMLRNPLAYGIGWEDSRSDAMLERKRLELIRGAAKQLDTCHMLRFDEASGNLAVTDLGRVASHYYITHTTIETFNAVLDKAAAPALSDAEALDLLCLADEFKNIRVRDEELPELDMLRSMARVPVKGDAAHTPAKVNILLQAHISQLAVHSFTLVSDTAYVTQSAGRIARALFEIFLRKGWVTSAERLLTISKAVDRRLWWTASPLWQLRDVALNAEEIRRLEETGTPLDDLCTLSAGDLGSLIRHPKNGGRVAAALAALPHLEVEATVQPITRSIMRVSLRLWPTFRWNDRLHFSAEPWYVWIEDATNEHIYHTEYVLVNRRAVAVAAEGEEPISLQFAIPVFEPLPSQYWVRVVSDRWLGMETLVPISFKHLVLPERAPPHTDLLDLAPLPRAALRDARLEALYRFSHFNPVQTQMFHAVYHTDMPVLLGAPTGSGKTVAAELAVFRLWAAHPGKKAVYVAPLKALVAERLKDWSAKFGPLGRRVVELTGDFTPDIAALRAADVLITTPEKWDSISRAWRRRNYVAAVGLVILDEIHLLGEDRGPVLEVIVSRMRYIAAETHAAVRFVGLSTALANAHDLADWLGITGAGLYNFRPSVRPIPMEVHIQGFPGKHYCLAEDMQILTADGFMFLDQLAAARHANPQLAVAAYDHGTQTFAYVQPSALIVNPTASQDMIELAAASEAGEWRAACDPYAAAHAGPRATSLLVTPDHDMFVRRSEGAGSDGGYTKAKAGDLVGVGAVQILGRAAQGFSAPSSSLAAPMPYSGLGVDTPAKELAFLALLGFWLGGTCLPPVVPGSRQVHVTAKGGADAAWLRDLCATLCVPALQAPAPGNDGAVHFALGGQPWYDVFQPDAAAPAATADTEEARVLPAWAWRLGRTQARAVIAGLQRASGEAAATAACGAGAMDTASMRLRDDAVRLGVHAGFATDFTCLRRGGEHGGLSAVWRVTFRDAPEAADPTLQRTRDSIKAVAYRGRTWCVTVPTGLIVVRRAGVNAAGEVTKASLTQIVGNCPRMATMNKPAYAAIKAYSPEKPALIFVSSRRQTRLTALDLIALAASDDAPRRFLRMPEEDLEPLLTRVKDEALAHTLRFGIGMHHAGLPEGDRGLVEELYENGRIQVLVATSTLAWGVNFPAHLVVVKGTEFFDGKTGRYVDLPLTDVLQMMGRAGRPQFDTHAVAVILVHEPKKNFYRKFLYEPFPVESHLAAHLAEHLNAEVAGGTIVSRHDAVEYLTWTYYFRRLLQNPAYYGVEDASNAGVQAFLYALVDGVFAELERSGCIARGADAVPLLPEPPAPAAVADALAPTSLGAIASFYYLQHRTMRLFIDRLGEATEPAALLRLMCDATEFDGLPVRHNEDELNEALARALPWPAPGGYDSPHVKAFLLLQARMAHAPLPITDYISDTKTVLDNTLRLLNAMVDMAADGGYLSQVLTLASLAQSAVTACFPTDSSLWQLRGASEALLAAATTAFASRASVGGGGGGGGAGRAEVGVRDLAAASDDELARVLGGGGADREAVGAFIRHLRTLPAMTVTPTWCAPAGGGVVVAGSTARVAAAAREGDRSVQLTVALRCTNAPPKYATTPYFARKKEFSWWLVAGDADAGELLALKRIPQPDRASPVTHTLTLAVPLTPGRLPVDLYLLSDTVRGIDQHVRLWLDVLPAPAT